MPAILSSFSVHSGFRIRAFHRLEQWNEFVHKIVKPRRIEHLPSNAILMIFWLSFFNALSPRIVGFHDTCEF